MQVFFWMAEDPCKQPRQLSHKDMKPCVFHKGHDYFQGSELAYLLGILLLVCFPLVVVFLAYLAIKVGAALLIKLEHKHGSVPISLLLIVSRCLFSIGS